METPKETMLANAAKRQCMFIDKIDTVYPHMTSQRLEDDRIFRNGTMAQSMGYFELPKPPSPLDVFESDTSSTIFGTK